MSNVSSVVAFSGFLGGDANTQRIITSADVVVARERILQLLAIIIIGGYVIASTHAVPADAAQAYMGIY